MRHLLIAAVLVLAGCVEGAGPMPTPVDDAGADAGAPADYCLGDGLCQWQPADDAGHEGMNYCGRCPSTCVDADPLTGPAHCR